MTDSISTQTSQKRWIVLLLALSCLALLLLNATWSPASTYQLRHSGQIDSLITVTFEHFQVPPGQIRRQTVEIGPDFMRAVYTADVPPGFSKTQWHVELDKKTRLYGLQTPARVIFPARDIRIHVTHGDQVLRTILLRSNPESRLLPSTIREDETD